MTRKRNFNRFERQKKTDDMKTNEAITASRVRVVNDETGASEIMETSRALRLARDQELDLVLFSEKGDGPPTCKILNYSKYAYQKSKQEKEKAKKQREAEVQLKEMQFRPTTDDHDMKTKISKVEKFLKDGNKVKIMIKYRGREQRDRAIMDRILEMLPGTAFESDPKFSGPNNRNLIGILILTNKAKKDVQNNE